MILPGSHILVTGGAGFIGSHLVESLLVAGHRVTVIDDVSTGSWANLAAVSAHPGLRLVEARISECAELQSLAGEVQAVFHLAAAVGVELVVRSPVRTILTNLRETEVVLAAADRSRVPVLVASTSEVYGKSQKEVFAEDDDLMIGPPTLARWSYACSKLMDEFLAMAYARERGRSVIVARLFNTVGPRQSGRYGMVLPRFIAAALSGTPLRVFGDGRQTRCFCYVDDTVRVLLGLMGNPEALGEVVNVGRDEEISIEDLACRVVSVLCSPSPIEHVPYAEAYSPGFEDMLRRRPVIEKAFRLTGIRPATPLDEIIRRTARYLQGGGQAAGKGG